MSRAWPLILAAALVMASAPGWANTSPRHSEKKEKPAKLPKKNHPQAATGCRATDGDSLRCGKERVRVRNVYAAELKDKGGAEAKANLQKKVDSGQVKIDRKAHDRYGRTIGEVYVDGKKVEQKDIGPKCGRGVKNAKC